MIEDVLKGWDGMGVVTAHDAPSGAWFFIALHDATLGPMIGGTRCRVYDRPEDGLRDAMRLAEGMTHKWAGIGLHYGGGKGVIALSAPLPEDERAGLFRRWGRLVGTLRGSFQTGQDLGTTPEDMLTIASVTRWVHGIDHDAMQAVDPGPYTARGVFIGIRAAVRHVLGTDDLAGRRVVLQGVGDVGAPLARDLAAAGATVLLSDLDAGRAEALARELGGEVVAPDAVYETACDVFAPCAVGATVNAQTIPRLACRIVAGSANNQLGEAADAERLHARGILYAPDYIINGGGATAFGHLAEGERDEAVLMAKVDRIEEVLDAIFREAAEKNESPVQAARRLVDTRLARRD